MTGKVEVDPRFYLDDYSQNRQDLSIVIPLTVIYSVIFLTGLIGNIITCVVITKNKSMHTATNYYLMSLAVSDLLLLVFGLPQEIYNTWYRYPYPFPEAVCILQGFAAETFANATVLTITSFTIERYVAICHPFLSHTMSNLSRAIKFIFGIWGFAMCLALPQIIGLGVTEETCTFKSTTYRHVFALSTILVFVLPMIVISVLYILIGLQLRSSNCIINQRIVTGTFNHLKNGEKFDSPCRSSNDTTRKKLLVLVDEEEIRQNFVIDHASYPPVAEGVFAGTQENHTAADSEQRMRRSVLCRGNQNYATRYVVKMLVAVVVTFFVCWAPHHAQRLYSTYASDKNNEELFITLYDWITNISGVLYYTSTCINPFLYSLMSHKFRRAFKDTISRYLYRRNARAAQERQGRLCRALSQPSFSHSQSTKTCSSSTFNQPAITAAADQQQPVAPSHQQQQHYLAQLYTAKRPVAVSFRKHPNGGGGGQPSSWHVTNSHQINFIEAPPKNLIELSLRH